MGRKVEIVRIEVDGVMVNAKACTRCSIVKSFSEYHKDKSNASGVYSICKLCKCSIKKEYCKNNVEKIRNYRGNYRKENKGKMAQYNKKYYKENRTTILQNLKSSNASSERRAILKIRSKNYYDRNPEKVKAYRKRYAKLNRDKALIYNRAYYKENRQTYERYYTENKENYLRNTQKRRTTRRELPCLPIKYNVKNPVCNLTDSLDTQSDHFIPLSWGHGGTYVGNILWLMSELNLSKNNSHPFHWFELNKEDRELSQCRFDILIASISTQNGLTPREYRSYVDWCCDNKRNVDEIRADNKRYGYAVSSLELWREDTGVLFPMPIDFRSLSGVG